MHLKVKRFIKRDLISEGQHIHQPQFCVCVSTCMLVCVPGEARGQPEV